MKYRLLHNIWKRTYGWLIDFQAYCKQVEAEIDKDPDWLSVNETRIGKLSECKMVILETLANLEAENRTTRNYINSLTRLLKTTNLSNQKQYISPPPKLNLLSYTELKNRSSYEIKTAANFAQSELERRWVAFNQVYALLLIKSPIDGFYWEPEGNENLPHNKI